MVLHFHFVGHQNICWISFPGSLHYFFGYRAVSFGHQSMIGCLDKPQFVLLSQKNTQRVKQWTV